MAKQIFRLARVTTVSLCMGHGVRELGGGKTIADQGLETYLGVQSPTKERCLRRVQSFDR